MAVGRREEKVCVVCGRRIEWRRKWARDWDSVRYCSRACRGARLDATDERLVEAMASMLEGRGRGRSICPSEVAREVGGESWRGLMERARMAARRLVASGVAEVTQGGSVVDPSTARGPIRVRLR